MADVGKTSKAIKGGSAVFKLQTADAAESATLLKGVSLNFRQVLSNTRNSCEIIPVRYRRVFLKTREFDTVSDEFRFDDDCWIIRIVPGCFGNLMSDDYRKFIERKSQIGKSDGFVPVFEPDFPFSTSKSISMTGRSVAGGR